MVQARGGWLSSYVLKVTNVARQDLADLLSEITGGGSFSTRWTAPIGDFGD